MSTPAESGGLFRVILSLTWLCDTVQGVKLKWGERFFLVKLGGGGARECASDPRPRFEALASPGWGFGHTAQSGPASTAGPCGVMLPGCGWRSWAECWQTAGAPLKCSAPSAGPSVEAVPVPCTGLWRHCSTGVCRSGAALDRWSPGARPKQGSPSPPAESLISPCSRQCRFRLSGELNSTPRELLGPGHPCFGSLGGWSGIFSLVCSGYQ